ncbi:MAG: SigB/SigF/SigG family RNA polymerase sigma factor [Clostridiales bacterium]|jgi:RNA polymerase sporulation-specific sigma factor|nr:SigB/SigF/SigG family RNA polymerase sigma factor [Clostridiales bacterium]
MAHRVEICGVNTGNLPKINSAEGLELIKKIQNGDDGAREYFIMCNIRLVLSLVQRFGQKASSDDLFQVGCVGLIKALNNFDTGLNVKFSTYAVPMIIGEIRRFLRDSSALKIGRNIRDVAYKAMQAREKLELSGRDEPTLMEIAAEIDVPAAEISSALEAICDPVSLYEPVFSDGGSAIMLMEQIGDTKNTDEKWIEETALKEAVKKLPERERKIIYMRYFSGKTQIEISEEIKISQAQVSRLEKNALIQMKKYL